MIGKLIIDGFDDDRYEHIFEAVEVVEEDPDDDEDDEEDSLSSPYDAGKDYLDNVLCGDILSIGTKWHNLPDFNEVNALFKEKYNIKSKDRLSIITRIRKFIDAIKIDI